MMTAGFRSRVWTAAALALLLAPGTLAAQVTSATVYGTVTDQTGSVLPGVDVTATHEGTGAARHVVTDHLGQFSISALQPGAYTITVELAGFRTYQQTGTNLTAGQRGQLAVVLEPGAVEETVTVVGAPALLSSSPQDAQTITTQEIEELPVANRDWTTLLEISTGAQLTATSVGPENVSFNALPSASTSFTVDGVTSMGDPNRGGFAQFQGYNDIRGINMESIATIEVTKGVFSAETSSMTGSINMVTKSGSNTWRGSLFESYQSGGLNARDPVSEQRDSLVRHQYGGSLGGPLVRNQSFIFGSIERPRLTSRQTAATTVPTPGARDTIVSAIPDASLALGLFPEPNTAFEPGDEVALWVGQVDVGREDVFGNMRYDHHLNAANQVTLGYTRARPQAVTPQREITTRLQDGVQDRVSVSYLRSASTWTSESRFGFNRADTDRLDSFFADAPAFPGMQCDCGFRIDGGLRSQGGSTMSFDQVTSLTRGRHNVKFGGRLARTLFRNTDLDAARFRFRTVEDLLAQEFREVRFTFGREDIELAQTQIGLFVQDDLRLTSRLTLNLGLRYDIWTVPVEQNDRIINRGAPLGFGPALPPDAPYGSDLNNVQPRVGLVYAANDRTVIRSGFGVFHGNNPPAGAILETTGDAVELPFRVTLSGSQALDFGTLFPTSNAQAEALGVRSGLISGLAIDENFPSPYSLQWSLGIERQLPHDIVVDIAYAGNHGLRGPLQLRQNRVDRLTGERPNPDFGEFTFLSPSDSIKFNALQLSVRRKFAQTFSVDANYAWSSAIGFDGEGDLLSPDKAVSEPTNIRLDSGPLDADVRHRFIASFLYEVRLANESPIVRHALSGWQLNGILRAQTGRPVDLEQSAPFEGQRPDFVCSTFNDAVLDQGTQYLDRSCFSAVPEGEAGVPLRQGTLSRNAVRLPGFWELDMALGKNVDLARLYPAMRLQLRLETFNLLNRTTYSDIINNVNNALFGQFTAARRARTVQLSARLSF